MRSGRGAGQARGWLLGLCFMGLLPAIGCRTDMDGLDPPAVLAPDAGTMLAADAGTVPPPDAGTVPAPDAGPPRPTACSVGTVHCSGRIPQTCGADGTWQNGPPCAYACQGGCVNRFTAAAAGRGAPTDEDGVAEFTRNAEMLYSKGGGLFGARGFNVAVIDPRTGEPLEPVRSFDPWSTPLSGNALDDLSDYLEAIEPGRLVMVATCDDAGITRTGSCEKSTSAPVQRLLATLHRMGSRQIDGYCFRGAWSFLAITGQPVALAEKLSPGTKVTAEVLLPAMR